MAVRTLSESTAVTETFVPSGNAPSGAEIAIPVPSTVSCQLCSGYAVSPVAAFSFFDAFAGSASAFLPTSASGVFATSVPDVVSDVFTASVPDVVPDVLAASVSAVVPD